jgi:hypothetical protein
MPELIANYTKPRAQIRELAEHACATRVIFLEGCENIGKSYLLTSTRPEVKPVKRMVIVDLAKRRGVPTPIEILTEISQSVGANQFTRFEAAATEIVSRRPIVATLSNVSINGSYNNVQATAQESDDDRLLVAIRATTAFLEDLAAVANELRPLILAFDGYDEASPLVDKWFDICLLPRLCEIDHLRLIVSAREVPKDTIKKRAGNAAINILLSGVLDEKEWLPIVTVLKRRVPGAENGGPLLYLQGVVQALEGRPGAIMPHLLKLETVG